MDRRAVLDKSQQAQPAAEVCQRCGRPLTDFGCRRVPLGEWCLRDGLWFQDPRAVIGPAPDSTEGAIAADRDVKRVQSELDARQRDYDQATRSWEAAARAELHANQ